MANSNSKSVSKTKKGAEKRRSRSRVKKWSSKRKQPQPQKYVQVARILRIMSPPKSASSSGLQSGGPVGNRTSPERLQTSHCPASSSSMPLALPILGCGPPNDDDDNPFSPPKKFQPEVIDPNLSLASVGGLEDQMNYLRKNVLFPMEKVDEYAEWGMEVTKGVIFHGPPGTGKTLLAKALAAELSHKKRVTFYMMRGGECFSKWIGDSEKKLRSLFAEAKAKKPSIIFLDELDGLCPSREGSGASHQFYTNIVTTLLGQLDAVTRGEVLVIGATNRLDALDPACKRPGRFDQAIAFLPPNEAGREEILNIKLDKWGKNKPPKDVIAKLAYRTVGFTGADLEQLCREAFNCALDRQMPPGMSFNKFELSSLRVTEEDWNLAASKLGRSNSNVFGNSIYSGSMPDPLIRPLIAGIASEIKSGLEQFLPTDGKNGATCPKSFGVKSFLVHGEGETCVDIADTVILPAVMASFDAEKTPGFMISKDTLPKTTLTTALAQLSNCRKVCFLFVPRIDSVWGFLSRSHMDDLFTKFFDSSRGSEIILVATSTKDLTKFPDNLRYLFRGMDREYKLRKPTTKERQNFFTPVFDGAIPKDKCQETKISKELEKLKCRAVKITENHEIKDVLDLQGELAIICNQFAADEKYDLVNGMDAVLEEYGQSRLDH